MTCVFADPKEWLLAILPSLQARSWQQSQACTSPNSRWCAYINEISLQVILDWIKAEYVPDASVWPSNTALAAVWEVVNGTAISLGGKRIVLIPSEVIDDGELEVPQEWVDIQSWAADYYLAVQVKPDGEWVRVWAYTTHQRLKSLGSYDPIDRTYCMDRRHLTKDLNAFSMTYQFCPTEETKAEIASLPELSTTQAENLLQRLSSSVTIPRLAVPFTMWGALLENEQWRQRLYQQRRTATDLVNLRQWLLGIYSEGWFALDTLSGSNPSIALSLRSAGMNASVRQVKLIDLGMQIESQFVMLLVALTPKTDGQVGIRMQLHPTSGELYLPNNIKLALLSDSGNLLQEVKARMQDNYVQLPHFDVEAGESFLVQVKIDNFQITETFSF